MKRINKSAPAVTRSEAIGALQKSLSVGAISLQEFAKGEEFLNTGRTTPAECIQSLITRNRSMAKSIRIKNPQPHEDSSRIQQYREEMAARPGNIDGVTADFARIHAHNRRLSNWGSKIL